jgi:hypothetical protein
VKIKNIFSRMLSMFSIFAFADMNTIVTPTTTKGDGTDYVQLSNNDRIVYSNDIEF